MFTLSEIAAAVGGRVIGPACSIRAVVTDSRAITQGCLFVALRGERFDGHKFVGEAARQGAAAALIDREPEPGGLPAVLVPDARLALGRLAAYWRRQLKAKVVAITGSNGKTSVKEMTAHILSRAAACLATEGNLNNDIGVPLTVLRCLKSHRYAVVEMGMNRPGEIANLAAIVAPDVACVTNAGLAHLAGLGSVRAIAEEKGQVYAALSARGVAVVNADDQFADYWRGLAPGRVVTYGLKAAADVSATYALGPAGSELMLKTPSAPAPLPVTLAVLGRHNVVNALAAAAIAVALDIPGQTIREGLGAVRPVHGRLEAGPG
jgi:UDP-N-acetylmuramoyl-tripeptide--D-alanyl-D-alanine ligase